MKFMIIICYKRFIKLFLWTHGNCPVLCAILQLIHVFVQIRGRVCKFHAQKLPENHNQTRNKLATVITKSIQRIWTN